MFHRNLRKKLAPKILMFLCVSLIGLLVTFLAGAQATSSKINCQIAAAFIQFFTLTTFCWMGVEAVNLYRSLVIVFKKGGNTSFLKKSCIFAVGMLMFNNCYLYLLIFKLHKLWNAFLITFYFIFHFNFSCCLILFSSRDPIYSTFIFSLQGFLWLL